MHIYQAPNTHVWLVLSHTFFLQVHHECFKGILCCHNLLLYLYFLMKNLVNCFGSDPSLDLLNTFISHMLNYALSCF
jgi:hypothetical protein